LLTDGVLASDESEESRVDPVRTGARVSRFVPSISELEVEPGLRNVIG
jgi:hypothetical protein